jgi:hypothetical protein
MMNRLGRPLGRFLGGVSHPPRLCASHCSAASLPLLLHGLDGRGRALVHATGSASKSGQPAGREIILYHPRDIQRL